MAQSLSSLFDELSKQVSSSALIKKAAAGIGSKAEALSEALATEAIEEYWLYLEASGNFKSVGRLREALDIFADVQLEIGPNRFALTVAPDLVELESGPGWWVVHDVGGTFHTDGVFKVPGFGNPEGVGRGEWYTDVRKTTSGNLALFDEAGNHMFTLTREITFPSGPESRMELDEYFDGPLGFSALQQAFDEDFSQLVADELYAAFDELTGG